MNTMAATMYLAKENVAKQNDEKKESSDNQSRWKFEDDR